MDKKTTPFSDETPFPEVTDDPFDGLKPADPFAGLRASSTRPGAHHYERTPRSPWRPGRGLVIGGVVGLVVVGLIVAGIVFWPSLQDRLTGDTAATTPTTTAQSAPTEPGPAVPSVPDVQAALGAAGFTGVSVSVVDGRTVLTGTLESSEAASAAVAVVAAQPGVSEIDNQIVIDDLVGLTGQQLNAAAADALAAAGFARVTVSVENGVATLSGFVPITALEDGFFSYVRRAEETVTRIDGIDSVVSQIGIKGNALQLRDQLRSLTESNPIVFESGSAALTAESAGVLDEVATAIISQPGLQVFIAGHTDTVGSSEANESLARGRAESVYLYLAQRGVPANRMFVVAYGELFPDAENDAASRRIEFEVGG